MDLHQLEGFNSEQHVRLSGDLVEGSSFGPVLYDMSIASILEHQSILQNAGVPSALFNGTIRAQFVSTVFGGYVGILKSVLGFRWPDDTIHAHHCIEWPTLQTSTERFLASARITEVRTDRPRAKVRIVLKTLREDGQLLASNEFLLLWGHRR